MSRLLDDLSCGLVSLVPGLAESGFKRAAFEDGHHKRPYCLCVVSTDATEYCADVSRLLLADVVTWLNPPLCGVSSKEEH